jgi:hypothetical protein
LEEIAYRNTKRNETALFWDTQHPPFFPTQEETNVIRVSASQSGFL